MNDQTNLIPYEKWPWRMKLFAMHIGRLSSSRQLILTIIFIQFLAYVFVLIANSAAAYGHISASIILPPQLATVLWIERHSSGHLVAAVRNTKRNVVCILFLLVLFAIMLGVLPYLSSLL